MSLSSPHRTKLMKEFSTHIVQCRQNNVSGNDTFWKVPRNFQAAHQIEGSLPPTKFPRLSPACPSWGSRARLMDCEVYEFTLLFTPTVVNLFTCRVGL